MPIYEYYCPDNHKIYQFYAKTLAQGKTVPRCPDGAGLRMEKLFSPFAVARPGRKEDGPPAPAAPTPGPEDARMESAMAAMEGEMAGMDENDPRAMGRMMRRMAELTGEKIDGEMEAMVRKLEEGADPESLDEALGAGPEAGAEEGEGGGPPPAEPPETRARLRVRRGPPLRDPKLYDYDP